MINKRNVLKIKYLLNLNIKFVHMFIYTARLKHPRTVGIKMINQQMT